MNYFWKEYKKNLAKKVKLFKLIFMLAVLFSPLLIHGENGHPVKSNSFLELHKELYPLKFRSQDEWCSSSPKSYFKFDVNDVSTETEGVTIDYMLYPYWQGRLYTKYNWSNVKRMGYFGYIINPETGYPNQIYSWEVPNVIETAKQFDTAVDLVLFCNDAASTDQFLSSEHAVQTCIDNSYKMISLRKESEKRFALYNADGINVFFPYFSFQLEKEFETFIKELYHKLKYNNDPKQLILTFSKINENQKIFLDSLSSFYDTLYIRNYNQKSIGNNVEINDAKKSTSGVKSANNATINSNTLLNLNQSMQVFGFRTQDQWNWDSLGSMLPYYPGKVLPEADVSVLNYMMYPYWQGRLYIDYNWDSILRFGYFGYFINPENGTPSLTYSWNVNNVVEEAKKHNTKVDLVLFSGNSYDTNKFLGSDSARSLCIQTAVKYCTDRNYSETDNNNNLHNADGINIFFPFFDFKMKREYGLFIKELYWNFRQKNDTVKIIATFPMSDTIHFNYLLGIEKYIDELHFANYDYRGFNPDEVLTKKWNRAYKSDSTDLDFFGQIAAEMRIAEFVNPLKEKNSAEAENKWEYYFLAICTIVLIIFSAIGLSIFWCKFNQFVADHLVLSILLLVLLIIEIIFLFFFMVEEMNFDIWLINTNNPNSNFFLLVPIVMLFLFPIIKILQNRRNLP